MGDRVKSVLASALAVALSACASQPPAKVGEESVAKKCIRETGTRIKVPEGRCVNVPGGVYTAKDLERSGAQTLGDAMRRIGR